MKEPFEDNQEFCERSYAAPVAPVLYVRYRTKRSRPL